MPARDSFRALSKAVARITMVPTKPNSLPPARATRSGAARRTLKLETATQGRDWTCLGAARPATIAQRVATALAAAVDLPAKQVAATLVLSHDAHVRALNRLWRGFDKPTNVLSFPSKVQSLGPNAAASLHIGDLILAHETLAREARDLGIDAADHFRHLVLHGLLHLLGFDHETAGEAEKMEALETRILGALGVADPYAGTVPLRQPSRKPAPRSRKPRPT